MVEESRSQISEGTPPEDLPPEGGREQICAYFEMLRSYHVMLTVENADGVEMEGHIESLDSAKGRLVLSLPKASSTGMEPDDEVDLFFTVAGNRWVGRAKIHYHSDRRDRYSIHLPERLEPSDRRRELRAMLDPLEKIWGELISAQAPHLLIRGRISNISESGFRFSMETVLDTNSGGELDPEDLALAQGHALDSVRITGLRGEVLETQGRILDVSPGPLGIILGVRFKYLKAPDRLFLREYVKHHAFTPPEVLPPLQRIPFAEEILQEINAAAQAAHDLSGESVHPEDRSDFPLHAKKQLHLPVEVRAPEPEIQSGAQRETPAKAVVIDSSAMMRLKRFRSVILVMAPGQDRQALQNFLAAQGFTRVLSAGTLGELSTANKKGSLDVVLVDWQDPGVAGLDIADFLLHHPFKNIPKVILACPHVTTALAHEARIKGVLHLLVKPYLLDAAFVEMLLKILGEE